MISKRKIIIYLLPIFIVLITFISVNPWSIFPIGTSITFLIWFLTLVIVLWYKRKFFKPQNKRNYTIVSIYFLWMIAGVIRGMFVAEGYWEWKQWFSGTMSLALPVFVYVFSIPWLLRNVLKFWLKYAMVLFFFFYMWTLRAGVYQFYLGPILVVSCFLPIIPSKKWRYILITLLLFMIFLDFGARSQVIKASLTFLMVGLYILSKYISGNFLKITSWSLFIAPIILIYLGISGQFNVFEDLSSNTGKYKETRRVDGKIVEEDLAGDTRSFIYIEVLGSAIKNNYFLWGRSPARGNDSLAFGESISQELGTDKKERHKNEVNFPNVFTWLGLIGMLLYCAIYFKSAYLALYKSQNIFLKLVGVFIAFRFLYGWVEDINNFDILSISIWMMIGMAFSEEFRNMTNQEFKNWVKSIF
jgi:hypothetical protein